MKTVVVMLDKITPVIITMNEENNIKRTLEALSWANDIVIVDSGSTDSTLAILKECPNVRVFDHAFKSHSQQWNFAIKETNIKSDWVLALDADYIMSAELKGEISNLIEDSEIFGYWVPFKYCIDGKALRASLYPSSIALYRNQKAIYVQDGHTQRLKIDGKVCALKEKMYHDDRKNYDVWLKAQFKYASLEVEKITQRKYCDLSFPDRIRMLCVVAPVAVPIYLLFWKGLLLEGTVGFCYVYQRTVAEAILAKKLIQYYLGGSK